jgi:hypothetical protein
MLRIHKEGFWSQQTLTNFKTYSNIRYPHTTFNMDILQQQASEQEADDLLKNGRWQWSGETKDKYINAISHNTMIQINPKQSLDDAMKIYNENAIKQLLYWNTKEGEFVLDGLTRGEDTIKCSDGRLQKTVVNGYNYLNGYKNSVSTYLDDVDLPNEIPGFSFVNSVCNPCIALDNDYSCKFQKK